jgi:hypothetical protein
LSFRYGPTTCMPTGKPWSVNPTGTVAAGN